MNHHYLLPKDEGAQYASTQCGQREREGLYVTKDWDLVDCNRCWYYRSLRILTAEGLCS